MKKLLIATISLSILTTSCTKNLSDLNNDSKHAVSVPATSLFLAGEKSLFDTYMGTSTSSSPFRVLAQTWTENTYTYEAQYKFANYQAESGWWNNLYGSNTTAVNSVLNNLYQAKALFPTSVTNTDALKNDLIITDILEVYTYYLLVNTFGNIPYADAESRTNPFPKYDDAKTITYDLLTRIDTCINGLNVNAPAMGNADQLYKGNVAKWKKFASSLKLKMALLIADKDMAKASQKVQEAITSGVFQSNSDNATFGYQSSPTGNTNPVYQTFLSRKDFSPAGYLVNYMVQQNDPRLPLYFTKDPYNNYSGGIAGAGNTYGNLSQFSAAWLSSTNPGDMMDYSEVEFLLAEAAARGMSVSGTAESHYNNAITAAITYWGGSSTDATTYLAQTSIAYNTASGTWKQKIGYQKWISLADRGWDAWTEIRRLGYPNLDVVSQPIGASGNLPLRLTYPGNEHTANSVNWSAAVKAQGVSSDVVSTKLWWMQ